MNFKNKTVWITGASSGIGEALAYEFNKQGAHLILSARREDALLKVKGNLTHKNIPCIIIPFDLAVEAEVNTAVAYMRSQVQKLDILINNGGVSQRALAEETAVAVDRALMEVNFFGAVALTKAVLPLMISQKQGHIAVISSMAGKFGFPMRTGYCASKHAVNGFFEALRAEIKKYNIAVTTICPGRINTNISINALTGQGNTFGKMVDSHLNAMPASVCAKKIVAAIEKKKKEKLIGSGEVFLYYIRKFAPWLFYKIVDKINPV